MFIYIYIYIYIHNDYLSNTTCLMRPRLLYALSVVSRTIAICYIIRDS